MKPHFFNSETFSLTKSRFVYRIPIVPESSINLIVQGVEKLEQEGQKIEQGKQKQKIQKLKKIFSFAVNNTRKLLSEPKDMKEFVNKMDEIHSNRRGDKDLKADLFYILIGKMIESVKTDTNFLKKLISLYKKDDDDRFEQVAHIAIKKINIQNDKYFKELFEEKDDASHSRVKGEALSRIKDQAYLKKLVDSRENEYKAVALEGIWDQHFLGEVALNQRKYNNGARIVAIRKLGNNQILRKVFNEISYSEIGHIPKNIQEEVYELKEAARKRLKELGEVAVEEEKDPIVRAIK